MFQVTPVAPPIMVSVDRRAVTVGDRVLVRFHASGDRTETIAVVPVGENVEQAALSFAPSETWVDGSVISGTETLVPGPYDGILVAESGTVLSRSPLRVKPVGATTGIDVRPIDRGR